MTRRFLTVSLLSLALLTLAIPAEATNGRWLHVRVEEGHGTKVRVNLPLSLVDAVVPMIPDEHINVDGSFVVFDSHHWSLDDLRTLWAEIEQSPDMTFVTVEDEGEHVKVSKSGDYLLVEVEDRWDDGDQVNVKVPLAVVDALLSGEGDALDVRAAVRALAEFGDGELATITGRDETVRIWIDDQAESE